jgi:hypothetical protein
MKGGGMYSVDVKGNVYHNGFWYVSELSAYNSGQKEDRTNVTKYLTHDVYTHIINMIYSFFSPFSIIYINYSSLRVHNDAFFYLYFSMYTTIGGNIYNLQRTIVLQGKSVLHSNCFPILPWEVNLDVSRSINLPWEVDLDVSHSINLPWEVDLDVSRSVNLPWEVDLDVSRSINLLWEVDLDASRSINLLWEVDLDVSRSVTLLWTTDLDVSRSVNLLWEVDLNVSRSVMLLQQEHLYANCSVTLPRQEELCASRSTLLYRKNILKLFKSGRVSCYDMMLHMFKEINQIYK